MFSLQKLLYNWLILQNKTVNMLLESLKLLKYEQFVLLYYRLLPVKGVTIYTQVILKWINFLTKHSSSNCMWPWDFHIVLPPFDDANQFYWLSLSAMSLVLCSATEAADLFSEFFRINVQCFVILSVACSCLRVTV